MLGACEGVNVGVKVGSAAGDTDGANVGTVGASVGKLVGLVGDPVGLVGDREGSRVGYWVGRADTNCHIA